VVQANVLYHQENSRNNPAELISHFHMHSTETQMSMVFKPVLPVQRHNHGEIPPPIMKKKRGDDMQKVWDSLLILDDEVDPKGFSRDVL
jgi:hypothetical protein